MTSWFAERISRGNELLVLSGAYDALSAKLIAESSAEAVYCGGFAATASQHGLPDLGLLGLSDMAEIYRRLARVVGAKPLIVDGDAGHGGLLNSARTAEILGELGVAAFHLEDQVSPKRCGHLDGKDVVGRDEAVARIRAAVAVGGPDIIARTDAIAVHGFEATIDRANAFLDVGASAVFIDAPVSMEQIEAIPRQVRGPVIFNAAATGKGPVTTRRQIIDFGYAGVLHPIETLIAAVNAVSDALRDLLEERMTAQRADFASINAILGTDRFLEMEKSLAGGRPAA